MPFWKFGHKDINVKSISFSWRIDSLGLISFLCTSTINIKAMPYSLKNPPELIKLVIYIILKVNRDQLK